MLENIFKHYLIKLSFQKKFLHRVTVQLCSSVLLSWFFGLCLFIHVELKSRVSRLTNYWA